MKADEELIRWLLEESGLSKYKIWKDTGIPQATLSDLSTGKTAIANITLSRASELTEYAKMIKEEKGILRVIYTDTTDNKRYIVAEITTNHSMSIDEALELAGVNMDDWTKQQGWDDYDYESLSME